MQHNAVDTIACDEGSEVDALREQACVSADVGISIARAGIRANSS